MHLLNSLNLNKNITLKYKNIFKDIKEDNNLILYDRILNDEENLDDNTNDLDNQKLNNKNSYLINNFLLKIKNLSDINREFIQTFDEYKFKFDSDLIRNQIKNLIFSFENK